jgi:hypothetical protein
MLAQLGDVTISSRHVERLTEELGGELRAARDARVATLPPQSVRDQSSGAVPDVVVVEVDGGRIQTRATGQGPGIHAAQWKEDKIACLLTLKSQRAATDPHPEPPRCFLDRQRVVRLVKEISSQRVVADEADESVLLPAGACDAVVGLAAAEPAATECAVPVDERAVILPQTDPFVVELRVPVLRVPADAVPPRTTAPAPAPSAPAPSAPAPSAPAPSAATVEPKWQPQRLVRTCVATMANSETFGKLVATEAYARNFYGAPRRAFVADGQKYNWRLHARHFPDFVAIADFPHVLTYVFAAAFAVGAEAKSGWRTYVRWMTACWQGRVAEVIAALEAWVSSTAERAPPGKPPPTDPRAVVQKALTYLGNNRSRMDYPRYRCAGLPCMSAWMESLVKEFNYRVKGSEKFWNRGDNAEHILQVRAAVLSEDGRLAQHVRGRAGSAFRRHRRQPRRANPVKQAA